jgi:hypothetical protein
MELSDGAAAADARVDDVAVLVQPQTGSSGAPQLSSASTSTSSAVFNLANTILGAGLLGLPAAFAKCGMATGLLFLLVFAVLSALGLFILSLACDIAGRPASFKSVAERALPGSGLLLSAAIAIKCFGVATVYLVAAGDMMPQALATWGVPEGSAWLDRRLWSVCAALVVSHLSVRPSLHALRHTSLVALVCVLLVALLVVVCAPPLSPPLEPCPAPPTASSSSSPPPHAASTSSSRPCRGVVVALSDGVSTLTALPTFIFACERPTHQAAPPSRLPHTLPHTRAPCVHQMLDALCAPHLPRSSPLLRTARFGAALTCHAEVHVYAARR